MKSNTQIKKYLISVVINITILRNATVVYNYEIITITIVLIIVHVVTITYFLMPTCTFLTFDYNL